jgi:hypothetical protein
MATDNLGKIFFRWGEIFLKTKNLMYFQWVTKILRELLFNKQKIFDIYNYILTRH